MLNHFRNLQSLLRSHGTRWLLFRAAYALRKRTGLLRRQMPAYEWKERPLGTWLKKEVPSTPEAYAAWRRQHSPRFFFDPFRTERRAQPVVEARTQEDLPWDPGTAIAEGNRILNGELKYFAHKFVKTGFPPDWHKDPFSGRRVNSRKHWSEISDEGEGDIKFIWEASRFGMVYILIRAYASSGDERFPEAFWTLLESWAEANPPNTGPNWMDGQEAALRLMAWIFGYYAFLDSPSTTPERMAQFSVMVAAHAERIYKNIDYAISTHSNHMISEAFGLWLAGLLFPELKDAEKCFALGRQLLEQQAAAQLLPDGTYSMYSLNYHRFVLHLYLCMIRLAEINQSPVSTLIHDRVSASINFLSQLIDPDTGQMPVYGSNDGALVLPLNNCDFADYRPLLQLGSYVTKKELLFDPGPWDEDIFWLFGKANPLSQWEPAERSLRRVGVRAESKSSFPHGGIYILHGPNSKAIIRCTDWAPARSRPSHADQLHLDLWWQGINIACDAGTYLYSGEGIWRNGLARTAVHNTVTVDRQDQMKRLTRFTWTDWAKGKVLQHTENMWQGEHDGYNRLADPVKHRRTVLSLGADRWLVVDHLEARRNHHYALHWLLNDLPYREAENSLLLSLENLSYKVQAGLMSGKSVFSVIRGDPHSTRGWRSQYYAEKEPAISLRLQTDQKEAVFWTFFGLENDQAEMAGNNLKVKFQGQESSTDLQSLISNL